MTKKKRNIRGFTIAELLIASSVLALMLVIASSVYSNFWGSIRNLRAANLIYEEGRVVMERMVKETRNGTIDYEEYYNQSVNFFNLKNETYGKNYCEYSRQFYKPGPDGFFGTLDDESTGERNLDAPPPLKESIQKSLYLINVEGNQRTYLQRFERQNGNVKIGRIGMIKLTGQDYGIDHVARVTSTCPPQDPACDCPPDEGEKDGRIDTWQCDEGFTCKKDNVSITLDNGGRCDATIDVISEDSFVDITPASLDIVDLQFIVTPKDDPRKAYNEESVQLQPQVTIRLVARAHPKLANEFKGNPPDITLESTVSSRIYNEIITECNLKECLPNQLKACPKTLGVCGPKGPIDANNPPAQQTCKQAVWPGCGQGDYEPYANKIYGLDKAQVFLPAGKTFYENGSEIASCAVNDEACKQRRCSDTVDNDCNGLGDGDDPACLIYLCNNGVQDPTEKCIDVGGICDFIRPQIALENTDLVCFDGYDNDCNGVADEFDNACVNLICNNGKTDPLTDANKNRVPPFFAPNNYVPKNYLLAKEAADPQSTLNESCPDVGGLCGALHPKAQNETGALCLDGLDNDCNGAADELDPNCKSVICKNQQLDCGLVSSQYMPKDILTGYQDPLCNPLLLTDLDEKCVDAGGLCGNLALEDNDLACFDKVDNDCNQKFDGNTGKNSDPGCCPDMDVDKFSAISNTCRPPFANVEPPHGLIDCNDSDNKIFPGAPEICDDKLYPVDYADPLLANQPIDNNCSFANSVHPAINGLDRFDPTCCIDLDEDGYGVPAAYIFFDNNKKGLDGTVLCGFSASNHRNGTETPDCNDTNKAINAGEKEIGNLCRDNVDNDCDGTFDHIDFNNNNFDTDCCDFAAIELCNDPGGSDENCNALDGMSDHYCMEVNGRLFFDAFTSMDYKANTTTAAWMGNGLITIDPPNENQQVAFSNPIPVGGVIACDNITSVTLNVNADLPNATTIDYEISADGGTNWSAIMPAGPVQFPVQNPPLKDLRWKATLNRNGSAIMPRLNDITLSFVCQ